MPTATSLTVLVIDDDPLVRWALSEVLSEAGHHVITAATRAAGLNVVTAALHPFDVIFMDLDLPHARELTWLVGIRACAPQSGVILMAAYDTPNVVAEASRLGVSRVLRKPFDIGTVPHVALAVAAATREPKASCVVHVAGQASLVRCRWKPALPTRSRSLDKVRPCT